MFDAIIIGGGPAGASCAVWLARLGYKPILLESKNEVGGLCAQHAYIDSWNVSLPGATGIEVAANIRLSLEQAQVPVLLQSPAHAIWQENQAWKVSIKGSGRVIVGRFVVLASGVQPRGLPQWSKGQAMPESIVIGPGRHAAEQDYKNKRVAVLGGGDNAFENALFALDHGAEKVHVFARTVRAQQQFIRRLPSSSLTVGNYHVDLSRHEVNYLAWDLILVMYGWRANLPLSMPSGLQLSPNGFVETDLQTAQTSVEGIYAAGEVAQRMHPCVASAMADGVVVAKAIQARLEASG